MHRRQQETRAKRHIQEEAKERRRKRQNKREVERKEEEEEEEGAVNVEPQASDMLAPDVLEALVRAEEEDELVRDRRLSEQRVVTEQLRNVGNAPLSKRVVFPEERSVGPVTVRLIKPGHRQKASEAAKDFLKGKLYESIHRSDEMLYPTRGQQLLRLRK